MALARSLGTLLTQSYIQEKKNKSGDKVSIPEQIGEVFKDYYASLYGIHNNLERSVPEKIRQKITEYLDLAALPRLSDQALTDLEKTISTKELDLVLKDTPTGKAASPDCYSLTYYRTFMDKLNTHFL